MVLNLALMCPTTGECEQGTTRVLAWQVPGRREGAIEKDSMRAGVDERGRADEQVIGRIKLVRKGELEGIEGVAETDEQSGEIGRCLGFDTFGTFVVEVQIANTIVERCGRGHLAEAETTEGGIFL